MKTLVIGAAMIDMFMRIDRLPKSGEDVLCKENKLMIGGCAYNVASTLRNLGCEHDLCVPVGKGAYADIIKTELKNCGYPILIEDDSLDNGYCLSLVEKDGERTFITAQGIEGAFKKEWFYKLDMSQYQAVYLAGYQVCNAGGLPTAEWLSEQTDKTVYFAPGPVICDIEKDVMTKLLSVHPVLHLNEKELFDFTGEQTLEACMESLYAQTHNLIIVTLGADGAAYYDGKTLCKIPTIKATVSDTIGAGDSHIGAILGGLSKGMSMEESIRLANIVAANIVQVEGPVMTKEEFEKRMGETYEKN